MKYTFNSKTNCFETYVEQYETKVNEETGEEKQVLIPCTERLYTKEEVDALFAQCNGNKTLKSVDGVPTIVDRYTEDELELIAKTNRIAELKAKLEETDYKAIQKAEGIITAEEYEPMRIKREAWRKEIRECEEYVNTYERFV